MPTHKKGHDKDKYYHLAKDQGFRSRAAFKLIQINKRYDFLSKAKVCIDLCAAPGGWAQVASKTMPPGSLVLGIDLLPIRAIRNVKTIVSDITTAECRRLVIQELQGWKADVVLCDGAPNIGSEYKKDAYVQNELVLAALKTATDHLAEGGTFCTKVYRSQDYNSLLWVIQQLFEDVQAVKPNSSRAQSAEIFLVCMKYTAPNHIDPKLLDPEYVFREIVDPGDKKVDIFHKKYGVANRRHRSGYDESLGPTLSSTKTVTQFIDGPDPIRLLTDTNVLIFSEQESCQRYLNHPKTTEELKICLQDLKLLGKTDFKKIMKWRTAIREEQTKEIIEQKRVDKAARMDEIGEDALRKKHAPLTDEQIDEEIMEMRAKEMLELRKEKKREKKLASKQRERRALGISNESFGLEEDEELFALNPNLTVSDMNGIADIDLATEEVFIPRDKYEDEEMAKAQGVGKEPIFIHPSEEDLEEELDAEYTRYIHRRKIKENKTAEEQDREDELNEMHGEGREYTEKKARHERKPEQVLKRQKQEDEQLMMSMKYNDDNDNSDSEVDGSFDRDDDNDEDSDDEFDYGDDSDDDEALKPTKKAKKVHSASSSRPVVIKDSREDSTHVDRWFAHPLFKETLLAGGDSFENNSSSSSYMDEGEERKEQYVDDESDGDDEDEDEKPFTGKEMIAMMPKTDREIRSAKRLKENARKERKDAKKNKQNNESVDDKDALFDKKEMQIVANTHEDYSTRSIKTSGSEGDDVNLDRETLLKREMLRKGMGKTIANNADSSSALEIVPKEDDSDDEDGFSRRHDDRLYNSDEEEYDNHDRAMTLALGTMMLRNSKKKAIVDASYNRYSWNDPNDLPAWFQDDEMKHNKPQLPVPKALVDQIKGNFNLTGTKEIKKVAEARARKRKRAMSQLKAAKKQAAAVAENSELSDKQKVRAIAKAMKASGKSNTTPGKVLVVARRTNGASVGNSKGGKGKFKFVDKRSKKDRRALKVQEARKKKGKKKSRK